MAVVLIPLVISLAASAASMGVQRLIAGKQKQKPIERGRNDDIRVFTSEYGSYIPYVWGTVRLAPNLIQASQILPVKTQTTETTGGGGKGGGGRTQVVTNYSYYTTLDLLFCQGEVDYIGKLWANTDLIYSFAPDPNSHYFEAESGTLSGSATISTDAGCSNGHKVTSLGTGSNGKVTFALPAAVAPTDNVTAQYTQLTVYYKSTVSLVLKVAASGGSPVSYTLPAVPSGNVGTYVITLSGFATSIELSNNGATTVDVDRIQTWFSYLTDYPDDFPTTGIDDPFIDYPADAMNPYPFYNYKPAKITTSGQNHYSFSTQNTAGIRIYTGSASQPVDSAIIADLDKRFGIGNGVNYASAHRGKCRAVLDTYKLPDGGMPNFTGEVTKGTGDLPGIITDLYGFKGIASGDLDLTAITGMVRSGLIVSQLSSPMSIVNSLEQWHGFKMIELDGKIRAILDVSSPVFNITTADVRAHDPHGEQMPESDVDIQPVTPEDELSQTVYVNAMDPAIDYKNNVKPSQLFASTLATDVKNYTFPFVASVNEIQATADMLLIKEHVENLGYSNLVTLPKFAQFAPGDCGTLTLDNATHSVRLEQKQMDLFGKCIFTAVSIGEVDLNPATNTPAPFADTLSNAAPFPANTVLRIFESLPVVLTDTGLGVYIGVSSQGRGKWQGCQVQHKLVTSEDWKPLTNITQSTPIGLAQTLLPDRVITAGSTTGTVKTTNTGFTQGTTAIAITTSASSSFVVNVGDYVRFAGDNTMYVVASSLSLGASASGTLVIQSPGLVSAIPAVLTAVSIPVGGEDTVSSVTTYFYEDVTFSSSTSLILNGRATANLLRWGDEWLQFRSATAASLPANSNFKSAWTFTNLIRGCFGTQAAKASHSSRDIVTGYDHLQFVALDSQYLYASVDFIAPSAGQTTGTAPNELSVTITGLSTLTQPDTGDRANGLGTPSLCIAAAVTNTAAQISVTGYTTLAKYRKIEYSANSDMSGALSILQSASDYANNQLPSGFTQTKTSESGNVTKYFRVSHSAEGLIYGTPSAILTVVFATSGGSGGSAATCGGTVLPPPTLTSATFSTPNINLVLAANGGTGTIRILRQSGSGTFTEIGNVAYTATTYSDTSITLNGTYNYKLTQDSVLGESATLSSTATGLSGGSGSPPSDLSGSYNDGLGEVDLDWTNNGATGTIKIERRLGSSGTYAAIASGLSSSTVTYADTDVVAGIGPKTYYYRVSNASVTGYSNTVSVVVVSP